MAKKKKRSKLPSGNLRTQRRYMGEDGKSHTKSFTAATSAELEAMVKEWEEKRNRLTNHVTVYQAVERYIAIKGPVLSPATVRGYTTILKQHLTPAVKDVDLLDVTNLTLQVWISDLTARGLSPKTIRNAQGLVVAAIQMFMPDMSFRLTLPQRRPQALYCPSAAEVRAVADTSDPELRAAILLAAVGTLRRGEICGLSWSDLQGNVITVRHSLVKTVTGGWVLKGPKTPGSYRAVPMTDAVIEAVKALPVTGDRIFTSTPDQLGRRFRHAVEHAGVHHFRFHDLRHFSASQMHLSGIPDKYIEARGGWKPGSTVMKTVYQDVIDLEQKKQDKKILKAFSAI